MKRLAACLLLITAQPVFAARCPVPNSSMGQSDEQRLAFLSAVARREASHIGLWKLLSGATFALLSIGQLVLAPVVAEAEKTDYYWGAGYSALGLTSTLLPAPAVYERGAAFADEAARATDENRCQLIAEGERLLSQGADGETLQTKWYTHAINVAVNVSLGAILGLGYQHWRNAIINTLAGIAISETILFTKPHGLISAWRTYTQGERPVTMLETLQFRISPSLDGRGGLTLGFGGRF